MNLCHRQSPVSLPTTSFVLNPFAETMPLWTLEDFQEKATEAPAEYKRVYSKQTYQDFRIYKSLPNTDDADDFLSTVLAGYPGRQQNLEDFIFAHAFPNGYVTVKKHSGPELDKIMAKQFPDFAYAKKPVKPVKTVIRMVRDADKKAMKKAMKKQRR